MLHPPRRRDIRKHAVAAETGNPKPTRQIVLNRRSAAHGPPSLPLEHRTDRTQACPQKVPSHAPPSYAPRRATPAPPRRHRPNVERNPRDHDVVRASDRNSAEAGGCATRRRRPPSTATPPRTRRTWLFQRGATKFSMISNSVEERHLPLAVRGGIDPVHGPIPAAEVSRRVPPRQRPDEDGRAAARSWRAPHQKPAAGQDRAGRLEPPTDFPEKRNLFDAATRRYFRRTKAETIPKVGIGPNPARW